MNVRLAIVCLVLATAAVSEVLPLPVTDNSLPAAPNSSSGIDSDHHSHRACLRQV